MCIFFASVLKSKNTSKERCLRIMTQTHKASLFERLGGKPSIDSAVDIFYQKVLADESLKPFFKERDMKKQIGKQRLFMTYAFGGSNHYDGENMYNAHTMARAEGLNESHFNKVTIHLNNTLEELSVPEDLINEVIGIVVTTKDDVLGIKNSA